MPGATRRREHLPRGPARVIRAAAVIAAASLIAAACGPGDGRPERPEEGAGPEARSAALELVPGDAAWYVERRSSSSPLAMRWILALDGRDGPLRRAGVEADQEPEWLTEIVGTAEVDGKRLAWVVAEDEDAAEEAAAEIDDVPVRAVGEVLLLATDERLLDLAEQAGDGNDDMSRHRVAQDVESLLSEEAAMYGFVSREYVAAQLRELQAQEDPAVAPVAAFVDENEALGAVAGVGYSVDAEGRRLEGRLAYDPKRLGNYRLGGEGVPTIVPGLARGVDCALGADDLGERIEELRDAGIVSELDDALDAVGMDQKELERQLGGRYALAVSGSSRDITKSAGAVAILAEPDDVRRALERVRQLSFGLALQSVKMPEGSTGWRLRAGGIDLHLAITGDRLVAARSERVLRLLARQPDRAARDAWERSGAPDEVGAAVRCRPHLIRAAVDELGFRGAASPLADGERAFGWSLRRGAVHHLELVVPEERGD